MVSLDALILNPLDGQDALPVEFKHDKMLFLRGEAILAATESGTPPLFLMP
jgi:hypothetical protein